MKYKLNIKKLYLLIFLFSLNLTVECKEFTNSHSADVIIYGGTSAALTAAMQVSIMGKSVIKVSPDNHLGGLSSGGLGFTDTGNKQVIGGLACWFYQQV